MTIKKVSLLKRFNGLALWVRFVLYAAVAALIIFAATRFYSGLHQMIFGNSEAKKAEVQGFAWEQDTKTIKETGLEASKTATSVSREHAKVDHTVQKGRDRVHQADHGQQMDPAIDQAVAVGLCELNGALCRPSVSYGVEK